MKLLPVALNVEGRRCLVVGGGPVAERKVRALLECGARVSVIAPELSDGLAALHEVLAHLAHPVRDGDTKVFDLVFACTDSREVNERIAEEARWFGIWCNVAGEGAGGDFYMAAAVRRGDVCVGVTTSGGSPALARHLRERVEATIGPEYAALLEIMSAHRVHLKTALPEQSQRAQLWRAVLQSGILQTLREGDRAAAEKQIESLMQSALTAPSAELCPPNPDL